MENLEIPPFYIGQEVVANASHSQEVFKKGDEFIVLGINKSPCGCSWRIDIGKRRYATNTCGMCGKDWQTGYIWYFNSYKFSPKIEITEFISMKQLAEQQLELISVN